MVKVLRFALLILWAGLPLSAQEKDPAYHEEAVPIERPVPALRVLTWNIQYGAETGAQANRWPERKTALKFFLEKERPDLLCVQEALKGQVEFLEKLFPTHRRIGVGRDDGADLGEFCAIFFDPKRLKLVESGTFWLGETPEKPCKCWADRHPRICTWARFEDPLKKKTFRLFNTHFPLNPVAGEKAARQLSKRIREQHPEEPLLCVGDFNSGPGGDVWKTLYRTGLRNSEIVAQRKILSRTFHLEGFPTTCIDAIFVSPGWGVADHRVFDKRLEKLFPSDHFGLVADLHFASLLEPKPADPEPGKPFKFNEMEPLETQPLVPDPATENSGEKAGR